jgi:hypothetical protein
MNRIGIQRGWPSSRPQQFEMGRSKYGHLLIGDASELIDKVLLLQEMF